MLVGTSFVNTSDGSCPMISIGIGFEYGRASFGSAEETADTHTAVPSTSASRNVRTLEARRGLIIFGSEKVREESFEPHLLWRGDIGAEERGEDVFESLG